MIGKKLIILGFDGADPDLLKKWLDQGRLPNIAKIIHEGVSGRLKTVPNMLSPAAWTSFATGKNSGKHGVFGFTQRDFSGYGYKFVNGSFRKAETFWEMLCGPHKGCIVNIPMTYPVQPINGCIIAGFDAPGVESKGFAYPGDLMEKMTASAGPYRVVRDLRANLLRKGGGWDKGAGDLLKYMEMRYRHVSYLMENYDWELFGVVFGETDYAQHLYWKFLDPAHPEYDPEEAGKFGSTIYRVYQRMDSIVGRIRENNPGVAIMIVSDHGASLYARGEQFIPDWLSRMGLLTYQEKSVKSPAGYLRNLLSAAAAAGYRTVNRRLSTEMKFKLVRAMPRLREKIELARRLGAVDWSRTKAYCDGVQDEIWINLKGRDPMGIVEPDDYNAVCDFICGELRNAVDAATGRPIAQSVFKRQEVYRGDYTALAPDISVVWNSAGVISGINSPGAPRVKPVRLDWPYYVPTGGHAPDGIFIACGPEMVKGRSLNGASIEDIAPTVLYYFGEEIPKDMDGKVLKDIFDQSFFKANPPGYRGEAGKSLGPEQLYSDEDSQEIAQRLRDLGYI